MLLGGNWLTCILAAVTTALIDRLGRLMNRYGTPFFFQHAAGAMVATLVAVAAYLYAGQEPTALVATGIVVLLSGMTLVGSVQDALTGYMLTAVARLGEALFLTAGIVVGILAGLQVAALSGIEIELHVDATESFVSPNRPLPIAIAVAGAVLAGMCLAVASYAPLRSLVPAGLAAGLAELVLIGLGNAGFGQVVATGIAAVGVGLLATLISIRRQAPALVTATAGIMPMLPGLAVFRAVFYFAVDKEFGDGLAQMLAAAAMALALGSGVVMGEFLGSPLRYRAGRIGDLRPGRGTTRASSGRGPGGAPAAGRGHAAKHRRRSRFAQRCDGCAQRRGSGRRRRSTGCRRQPAIGALGRKCPPHGEFGLPHGEADGMPAGAAVGAGADRADPLLLLKRPVTVDRAYRQLVSAG